MWTLLAGFGFGWVQNLLTNGTVRSWAAPATAVGLALTNTLHAVGLHGVQVGSVLSVTRLIGLLTAAGFAIWLLWHAEERGWVRSLALSLILFVELGPVVQPWYLAWGLVLLAASYKGREHFWLLALSITGPFIGTARRARAVGRPRALESAPDRGRGRDPRRGPDHPDGPLDAVVVAGARDGAGRLDAYLVGLGITY